MLRAVIDQSPELNPIGEALAQSVSPSPSLDQAGEADPAQEIFLTPRVLDHRAFEEYTKGLRAAIEESSQENRSLRGTADELRGVHEQTKKTAKELQRSLELAARAMGSLEEKIRRAQEPVARPEVAPLVRSLLDTELSARGADVSRRAAELTKALPHLQELARRAEASKPPSAEEIRSIVGECVEQALNARLASLQPAQATPPSEEILSQAGALLKELAEAKRQAEQTHERLAAAIRAQIHSGRHAGEQIQSLERTFAQARQSAQEAQQNAAALARMLTTLRDDLAALEPRQARLREEIGQGRRELESLAQRCEQILPGLDETIAGHVQRLDEATLRSAALENAVNVNLASIGKGEAAPPVTALAGVDPAVLGHLEHMGGWLGQLIASAQETGQGLEQLLMALEQRSRPASS